YTLDEMVKHIYNKLDLLPQSERSHMFINELDLYIDYLQKYLDNHKNAMDARKLKYSESFKKQLQNGIEYYEQILPVMSFPDQAKRTKMLNELNAATFRLESIQLPN
ncbi:MAG: hypothetical protein ABI390_04360, partial [Daejeonella sp.]